MRARMIVFVMLVYGLLLSTLVVEDEQWQWALLAVGAVTAVVAVVILLVHPTGRRCRLPRRSR